MKTRHRKYILQNIGKRSVREISDQLNIKEKKIEEFLREHRASPGKTAETARTADPASRQTFILSVLLIIVLGVIAYSNSFKGQFLWDDLFIIRDNPYIQNWSHLKDILTGNLAGELKKLYRPVQMLTYVVDYSAWKTNVAGYHITNLVLHLLVALCLYKFIDLLFNNKTLSLFTSLLFVAHPIHSEAVYYMSSRADPLGLLFTLVCLILYVANGSGTIGRALLPLSYIAALLSRESSMMLPALILVYHAAFRTKVRIREFVSILVISVIYIVVRVSFIRSPISNLSESYGLLQRIPWFFAAIYEYIRLLFLPIGLHMEYGFVIFRFTDPRVMLGLLLTAGLLVTAVIKRKSAGGLVSFSILWFFTALIPFSNIYPINAYMAEHWLYTPSIGFFLLIAAGFSYIYNRKNLRVFAVIILGGLLVFYSYLTVKQAAYWKDAVSFYERTLKYNNNSSRMCNNLAGNYKDQGRAEDAIKLYKRAVELKSDYTEAYTNLGLTYKSIGKYDEAVDSYNKALSIDPNYANAYHSLGVVYSIMGKDRDAIEMFKKSLSINPMAYDTCFNLGIVYETIGDHDNAIASYEQAIKYNPTYPASYSNLALVFYKIGQYQKALEYSDKAAALGYKANPAFLKLLEPYRDNMK